MCWAASIDTFKTRIFSPIQLDFRGNSGVNFVDCLGIGGIL
jgi:hypothetical protein